MIKKKIAIEFKNINFSYTINGPIVLDGVDFKIYEGEYICIVGHNGSGKSTISKVASGLLKPTDGTILIFEKILTSKNLTLLRENIGIIFQNPDNQFIGITAEDDIAFGLENFKVPQNKMESIIQNSAKIIDITKLLKKESHDLSGGQKQKVAITSILSLNPKVIIFDESTSMLDPQAKNELKALMKILQKKYNKTIISITHDMEELSSSTRVLVMYQGKVLKFDTPKNIFTDESFLFNNSLDIPFDLKLSKELKKLNVKGVNLTLEHDEIIGMICKR